MAKKTAKKTDQKATQALVPWKVWPKDKTLTAVELDRLEGDMTPQLHKVLITLRKWVARNAEFGLRQVWSLGERLAKVHQEEHHYGAEAIKKLSLCLSQHQSLLYKAIRFYELFSATDLDALVKLRMQITGEPVTFAHVITLFPVQDKNLREQLLQECIQNNWKPDELDFHVREKARQLTGQVQEKHAGGRPRKIPSTIVGLLGHCEKTVGALVKSEPIMYSDPVINFVRYIKDLPADKVTPGLVEKIDACVDWVNQAEAVLPKMRQQLAECRAIAEQKLVDQAQADGVVDVEVLDAPPTGDEDRLPPKLIGAK